MPTVCWAWSRGGEAQALASAQVPAALQNLLPSLLQPLAGTYWPHLPFAFDVHSPSSEALSHILYCVS